VQEYNSGRQKCDLDPTENKRSSLANLYKSSKKKAKQFQQKVIFYKSEFSSPRHERGQAEFYHKGPR